MFGVVVIIIGGGNVGGFPGPVLMPGVPSPGSGVPSPGSGVPASSGGIITFLITPNGPFVTGKVPIPTSSIVSPIIPGVVSGMISVITT